MSLATRHRENVLAAVAAGVSLATPAALPTPGTSDGPEAIAYRELLELLGEDLRRLSEIQSIEAKIAAKREMIHRYKPWVEGALKAGIDGHAAQDEIVVTQLIWMIDIGAWDIALPLAAHVLGHGLALPERYTRTPATMIVDEIANAALKDAGAVDHGTLVATDELTAAHDMPDQARAKLKKAIGRSLMIAAEGFDPDAPAARAGGKAALINAAIEALNRALALDSNVGVKKDLERLEREAKSLAAAKSDDNGSLAAASPSGEGGAGDDNAS